MGSSPYISFLPRSFQSNAIEASHAPVSYLEKRGLLRIEKRDEYCSSGRYCPSGYHCVTDTLCKKNPSYIWTIAFGILFIVCIVGICIRRRRASKAIVSQPTVVQVPGVIYAPPPGDPNLAYQQPAAYPLAGYPHSTGNPPSSGAYPPSTDAYPLATFPPATSYSSPVPYGEKPMEPVPSGYPPFPVPGGTSSYPGPIGAQQGPPPPQYSYPVADSVPYSAQATVPYPAAGPAGSSYPVPHAQGEASAFTTPH